jgi:small-conductance mechanosensitive channel
MSPILELLQEWLNGFVDFLPTLGISLGILLLSWILSRWLSRLVRRSMKRSGRDAQLIVLITLLTRWGLLALGIVIAAEIMTGGALASLIAGLGIAGLTIGFALQDVAKNFVAGILLLLQQPFQIGDQIAVAGYEGHVQAITLRTTELLTLDGRFVLIPNADVFTSAVVNYSRARQRRIEITVGVAADSDLDKAARVALQAIGGIPGLLADPSPNVAFDNFGESTIDFTLYYWIQPDETALVDARDEGIRALKLAFEREGVVLPYPTMTVLTGKSP